MLLISCSYKKPYSFSNTYRKVKENLKKSCIKPHIVVVTSPLGAVPIELEMVYPCAFYDISVTGKWLNEEIERSAAVVQKIFNKGRYKVVASMLNSEDKKILDILRERGIEVLSMEDLINTFDAKNREELTSRFDAALRYQFKDIVFEKTKFKGKYGKFGEILLEDNTTIGKFDFSKGIVELDKEGVEIYAKKGESYIVKLEDFELKGDNIFVGGVVEASECIAPRDFVVCIDSTDMPVCTGFAMVSGKDMCELPHGVAVKVKKKFR